MKKGYIVVILILLLGALTVLAVVTSNTPQPAADTEPSAEATAPPVEPHFIDVAIIEQGDRYPSGCESLSAVMALNHAGVDIDADRFIDVFLPRAGEPRIDEDDGSLMGDDPNEYYIGSPYDEFGYGCYAPVIIEAINGVLTGTRTGNDVYGFENTPQVNHDPNDGGDRSKPSAGPATNDSAAVETVSDELPTYPQLTVVDLSGKSLTELCDEYISRDIPVILWATIQMKPVEGTVTWLMYSGEEFTWKSGEHCLLLVGYDEKCYYFNDPLEGKDTAYLRENVEAAYEELYRQAVAVVKK